ncbi:hypothetical protein SLS62_007691 [Diatrype stigma]|uniref:NADP-dependent oxidoreductase domain-containing protein n=1 Tax=Diatrype stigma TaxID=117547 RepID=A0AAN9YQ27_9PEZI
MPQLAGKEVGPIGYGLMGLTWHAATWRSLPVPQEQAFEALHAAIKSGCNCWNGGESYGTPDNNSLTLLEKYFEKYPEDADKVVLNIKGGLNPTTNRWDGSIENTRRSLENSIAQLKGRKKIDMFEFARRDPNVPLEVTFGFIEQEYVKTGRIGGVALSEVRLDTIHEAMKYTKVLAVEVELSLFSTEVLENGVATACAEYGIPIIAYLPMSRGASTAARVEENSKVIDLTDEDMAEIDTILSSFKPAGDRFPASIPTDT